VAGLVTVAGVVVCNTRICNVTHQGAAHGGPVVLRPVTATPCFYYLIRLECMIPDGHLRSVV